MWFGDVLRHELVLHDITEGRMRRKATRGQIRMHLLSDLKKNRSHMEIKREAQRQSRLEN